jgi:hypothetical protein
MTEHLCVVCARRPFERAQVCNGDRLWLDRTLVEIVELYALLPANLMPGQRHGQRVSGSREAPLPLRVDPLDLSMPARTAAVHEPPCTCTEFRRPECRRGHPHLDQFGQISVASVLDSWCRDWADVRDIHETLPKPTVVELTTWLSNRLDWACDDHLAIDEFAGEMRRLRGGLAAVVGIKSDRVYVGKCPVTDDKGTCGAALTADPDLDIIRCPRCDTMWSRDKWLWLGMTIRAEVASA